MIGGLTGSKATGMDSWQQGIKLGALPTTSSHVLLSCIDGTVDRRDCDPTNSWGRCTWALLPQ